MKQFKIKPVIQLYESCEEFCQGFAIGEQDLVITSGHLYEEYLKQLIGEAYVVNLRSYGYGEPNDHMVEAILADISGLTYRRVFAIGGGSVLDVAKLFVLKQISPVGALFAGKLPLQKDKTLIMVPTTCGTGSEVTNISILELLDQKTKKGLAVDELYADYAALVPELLNTLPFHSFATSSIDAFIHSIESYLSPKANAFTRTYSLQAMELILKGYQRIATKGPEVRFELMEDFLLASTYAGIAFGNAGCAAVHALSYPLGAVFHIPHGEANYAVFHGVFAKYKALAPSGELHLLDEFLAKQLHCDTDEVYSSLNALFQNILPRRPLQEYGVSEAQLEEFTESVMINQGRLMANNYVTLTRADVHEIYRSVY